MLGMFRGRRAEGTRPVPPSWPEGLFDDEDFADGEGPEGEWLFNRVTLNAFKYLVANDALLAVVIADIAVWERYSSKGAGSLYKRFKHLYQNRQEFRSLVLYRVFKAVGSMHDYFNLLTPAPPWMHVVNLFLETPEIGPGLYIEHGFSTIVNAKKIGRNFWVNQNVTIGTNKGGVPTFGDDCAVRTGAVVVGGITIGDRVTIGANAFVDFDVPDDSIVAAPRGQIIRKKKR